MNTQAIIDKMNTLGLTYRTLAAKAGVSAKFLQSTLEGHDVMVFFDTLRVAGVLGLTMKEVLLDTRSDTTKNLASLVMEYCSKRGLEVGDIAEAAGMKTTTLRECISGGRRIANVEAVKLAEAMDIDIDTVAAVCRGDMSAKDALGGE